MTTETPTPTYADFAELLESRFGGVLRKGSHKPDGAACALEAISQAKRIDWTDSPARVGMPDLRPLNDAFGEGVKADRERTAALLPVIQALWNWQAWGDERQRACMRRVAERTIREIVPLALEVAAAAHPQEQHKTALREVAGRCREEGTSTAATDAADAAHAADAAADAAHAAHAAYAAAYAARAAADAAAHAARAAADAARAYAAAAGAAAHAARAYAAAAGAAAHAARAYAAAAGWPGLRQACAIWAEEAAT